MTFEDVYMIKLHNKIHDSTRSYPVNNQQGENVIRDYIQVFQEWKSPMFYQMDVRRQLALIKVQQRQPRYYFECCSSFSSHKNYPESHHGTKTAMLFPQGPTFGEDVENKFRDPRIIDQTSLLHLIRFVSCSRPFLN